MRQKNIGLVNSFDTFKSWIDEVIIENGLSKSGIFFIWDEFTEYVSRSDDHILLQEISNLAKDIPFYAMFIVHKSSELVSKLGGEKQYEKIFDRFHEVEFRLTSDASLDLIAGSINVRIGMEENWISAKQNAINAIKKYIPSLLGNLDDRTAEMYDKLCPMHPMTIRLLSLVAENYAASDRTMFRFMKDTSNEAMGLGFAGYINRFGPDDEFRWLTPEWLWDYFFMRDSDFRDKDTKVAEYIRHYSENVYLVENDEYALRVFKIVMLLLAVTSSTKGIYSGKRVNGGISATLNCLEQCLAGVMDKERVENLLQTLSEDKLVTLDRTVNDTIRLELPFHNDGGSFKVHFDANDKKYTRYQMFSKGGIFSEAFEKSVEDKNDVVFRRVKVCVCCAEESSINKRLEEINKELGRYPYKVGLLVVIASDDMQYAEIQTKLSKIASESENRRLVITLMKKCLTDDLRNKWLTSITNREMALESGQTGSAAQYESSARMIVASWVQEVKIGSKAVSWNYEKKIDNLYGIPQMREWIRLNVIQNLFPYAPDNFITTSTAYNPCKNGAPLAGINRATNDSQVKSVLSKIGNLLSCDSIDDVIESGDDGNNNYIIELAKLIHDEMSSGKVVLRNLWDKLMQPPFGYYDNISCGVLLGFVFGYYKDGEFSWTDDSKSTHTLGDSTLQQLILKMVKGQLGDDYLSSGSEAFHKFRDIMKPLFGLSDSDVASETECWRSMRSKINESGKPIWTLKYISDDEFGSRNNRDTAMEIIDQLQMFVQDDTISEETMTRVNELFVGKGKVRKILSDGFCDKATLDKAFRTFLFSSSPELEEISGRIGIYANDLSDQINIAMQSAIYTWTEEQVKEKLGGVVIYYNFLDALNDTTGTHKHSVEDIRAILQNPFDKVRIPLSAIERLNRPWIGAFKSLYKVYNGDYIHMSNEERESDTNELLSYGQDAMDFLKNGRTVLSDLLELIHNDLVLTDEEIDKVYAGLKGDNSLDTTWSQFEKNLNDQLQFIDRSRNKYRLNKFWHELTNLASVKDWCKQHNAPIFWLVNGEQREALAIVDRVQRGQEKVLNDDVLNALQVLKSMNPSVLNDDDAIQESLINTVGVEFKDIIEQERDKLMTNAKFVLGNDMSTWDISKQNEFRQILMRELQNKARREKLDAAKSRISSMGEDELRSKLQAFLEEHPEYCDAFN